MHKQAVAIRPERERTLSVVGMLFPIVSQLIVVHEGHECAVKICSDGVSMDEPEGHVFGRERSHIALLEALGVQTAAGPRSNPGKRNGRRGNSGEKDDRRMTFDFGSNRSKTCVTESQGFLVGKVGCQDVFWLSIPKLEFETLLLPE
jgi:hypothetical protein